MKRKFIIFVTLLILLGCGPYIWFKVPQPRGGENLDSFPEYLLGKYESVIDSGIIKIESKQIIKEYRENLFMTKLEFYKETGDTIPADTSLMFTDNWEIEVKSFGDSVIIRSSKDEELFKISEKQLLREFKKYYFLNYEDTIGLWKVKILRLYGDTLELDYILKEEDIKNIKGITTVKMEADSLNETSKYFLDPKKRELKKILRKRMHGEKYIRIN